MLDTTIFFPKYLNIMAYSWLNMAEAKLTETRWQKEFENPIYEEWQKNKRYSFQKQTNKPVYSIDTPPPYVNTPVHIGQATTYVLMDMFARFRRMKGYNVLFPLGLDRNGLPIEIAAEKKFGSKLTEVSREKALEMCEAILEASSAASKDSFLRLGISFNSFNEGTELGEVYLTDADDFRALTQETFIELWHKGLIYEDTRLNNFCPGCQTTLADSEVQREDKTTFLNDVAFTVKETGEKVIIATTRPELLCTAGMVIFHPDDERYHHLKGKTAIVPLFNLEVPIQAHPQADPNFGTGLVFMSLSAGDQDAIRFLIEMNLEPKGCIDIKGKMTNVAGFLEGLYVSKARTAIVARLKEEGYLTKQTTITHSVPVCERSKDEIQFIAMPEFYLKQLDSKEDMLRLADEMTFYAPRSKQILLDWIQSLKIDWPISRRRFYATEIPLWYCSSCNEALVPPKGKYYKPWKEQPPFKECPKCHATTFRGETRVFDTWFDSSITPLYILKYGRDNAFFNAHTPCSLRPQGKEIVRTWLYYTVLKDYLLTGKCIFKDVWINYHIVDEHGHKMSKSKGNSINPKDVLDRFGAEPFRLWAAIEGNLDRQDFRCSYERIEGASKTLVKLWNVARFISLFPRPTTYELSELDQWMIQEMNTLITLTEEGYLHYDFHNPAIQLKHFLWETFASHYIELVKARAYNQEQKYTEELQNGARYTLHWCLETLLRLLSPITPFIATKIAQTLYGEDIQAKEFPLLERTFSPKFSKEELAELNSFVWKTKKDKGLSLKTAVGKLTIPDKFKGIQDDLKVTHQVKEMVFGNTIDVEL